MGAVAFLGEPGAFSHEACRRFLPSCRPIGGADFAAVIETVANGGAEFGLLPIANNAAGPTGAAALIEKAGLRIVAEHDLPVRMHLLGLPGARMEEVAVVTSHPVALRQCARFLSTVGAAQKEAADTMTAARSLRVRSEAALASETAAGLLGLTILHRNAQDRDDNITRFAQFAS